MDAALKGGFIRSLEGVYRQARRIRQKFNIGTQKGNQLKEVNKDANGDVFFFFLSSAMMKLRNTPRNHEPRSRGNVAKCGYM